MLRVQEENGIALVSLDRPEVRNAFNPELIQKITATFETLSTRNDLRAIVLSGEGKAFCAGADLHWMKSMVQFSLKENQSDAKTLFAMFETLWNCPIPIIGVIHGSAFGGALGLIATCDYVIAEQNTQMSFSEVKIGIVPAVISAFILRKTAAGALSHLMISGKVFTPKEVLGTGLVHEVVADAHLAETLGKVVQNFEMAGPEAVRETKKLVRKIALQSWDQAREESCRVIAERRVSAEGQEGLKSFLEKRSPNWKIPHGE